MKKILIAKNIPRECPGLIKEVLGDNGLGFEEIDLNENRFPDTKNYSAVFVLGGPDSANDSTPKIKGEIKRISEAVDAKIPFFGVCLGMQALVKARGGEVFKNPVKEIGCKDSSGKYFQIELTQKGKSDMIFRGCDSKLKIFQLHGETVKLTSGMDLLAAGDICKNQVVKIGDNAYGFQGHLELTGEMFERWLKEDADLRTLSISDLREHFYNLKSEYEKNGMKILNNFVKLQ